MGRGRQDMSIWVGMGMDRSAVAGYGKGAVGNEATFERGQYGNRIKKLLEPCLKVEREILAVKDSRNKGVRDGGTVFGSLLMPAFGFGRFFTVPAWREEFAPLIKGMVRSGPKPVHEIIVRTQRGKRVNGASDQRGEDAVRLQTAHPSGKGRGCKVHGDQKEKEDEGTEDLRMV